MARTSGACSTRPITNTFCPGWMFAPTRTTSSAYAGRRSSTVIRCRIETRISRVEGDVVPGRAFAGEPVERVLALDCDRTRLRDLLRGEVAVDLSECAEVAAHRLRQQPLL